MGITEATGFNPFVFIVGCPRSGTTLLERMVDAHPEIAIIHESHWITRFWKRRIGLTQQGCVTPELIRRLGEHHRFHLLKMSLADLEGLIDADEDVSFAEFVSRLFDLYGRQSGKRLVGDKTTGGYLRNLDVLHALWPNARFVHLVRDGRNVCLSMLNWPKAGKAAGRYAMWSESPVGTTALWWAWQLQQGIEGARTIARDRYHELHYESFVAHPQKECAKLCSFLGVQDDDAMRRFNEGRENADPGKSANQAWRSPTPGLRDWRRDMAEHDVELFEALAGPLLSQLGYERAFEKPSPGVAAEADRLRLRWHREGP